MRLLVHLQGCLLAQVDGDGQTDKVEHGQRPEEVLEGATAIVDDEIGQLVARETGPCPCGEGKTVNGGNLLHAELAIEQGRKSRETASVSCIDDTQHDDRDDDEARIQCVGWQEVEERAADGDSGAGGKDNQIDML